MGIVGGRIVLVWTGGIIFGARFWAEYSFFRENLWTTVLLKKYLVSDVLPAKDIWWAGKSINYYSFGHFMASILVRLWGVGLEKGGYNLVLAFILGLSLSLLFLNY